MAQFAEQDWGPSSVQAAGHCPKGRWLGRAWETTPALTVRADSSLSWLGETLESETAEPVHCNSIFKKAYFMYFPCRKNSQKDTCQNVNICQFWLMGLGVVFIFLFSAFSDFHITILITSVKQKYSFLWASRCKCFCQLVFLANMPDACAVTPKSFNSWYGINA